MAQLKPPLEPAQLLFQTLQPIMLDLNSPHLDPQIIELRVELLLHVRSLLSDLVFHPVAIKIFVFKRSNLILRAADVFAHLLDLLELLEELVGEFSGLEDFVGSV